MASTNVNIYRSSAVQAAGATNYGLRVNSNYQISAQSFMCNVNDTIPGIDIQFNANSGSPTGTLYIELWSPGANPGSGSLLSTSNSISVPSITAGIQSFAFSSPPAIIDGQQYYFRVVSDSAISSANYVNLVSATANSYASGTVWAYNGSVWSIVNNYDFNFWVFTSNFKKWYIDPALGASGNDGKGPLKLAYTSGSRQWVIGETIVGNSSSATAVVMEYTVTSGSFAGGDAAGNLYLWYGQTGTFTAEDLNIGANSDVATVAGNSSNNCFDKPDTGTAGKGVVLGDIGQIVKSPDPYDTGVSATVVNGNKTITLSSALTKTINNCTTAWTAAGSGNTTGTNAFMKIGATASLFTIATTFTTGKCGYIDLGSNQDFSAYTAISVYFATLDTSLLSGASLSIKLCSDTTGDTPVDNFQIIDANLLLVAGSAYIPIKILKQGGGSLGVSIRSIGLYVDGNLKDSSSVRLQMSNLIACNSFSHQSLFHVGVPRTFWAPDESRSLNDEISPSQASDSFLWFKCTTPGTSGSTEPSWTVVQGETTTDGTAIWTCQGPDECWFPVQSIDGTTLIVDNIVSTLSTSTVIKWGSWSRSNGTYALWARETIKLTPVAAATTNLWAITSFANVAANDKAAPILGRMVGGIDFTNGQQNGMTCVDAQNGLGRISVGTAAAARFTFENLMLVRANLFSNVGDSWCSVIKRIYTVACIATITCTTSQIRNVSVIGIACIAGNYACSAPNCSDDYVLSGVVSCQNATGAMYGYGNYRQGLLSGWYSFDSAGLLSFNSWPQRGKAIMSNMFTKRNVYDYYVSYSGFNMDNCLLDSSQEIYIPTQTAVLSNTPVYSSRHDRIANSHRVWDKNFTGSYQTSLTHGSATGAWRGTCTSALRSINWPMQWITDQFFIFCRANVSVTAGVWFYRDHANANGKIVVRKYAIDGISTQVESASMTLTSQWERLTITFTPTADGLCPFEIWQWDGITTDKNLYFCDYSQTH